MFCPRCKTEYREGFAACADCNLPLVAKLPEEIPIDHTPEKWIKVAVFDNLSQAQTSRSILEGQGIACMMQDENAVGLVPIFTYVLGGIKLFVAEKDEAEAREILAGMKWGHLKNKKDF